MRTKSSNISEVKKWCPCDTLDSLSLRTRRRHRLHPGAHRLHSLSVYPLKKSTDALKRRLMGRFMVLARMPLPCHMLTPKSFTRAHCFPTPLRVFIRRRDHFYDPDGQREEIPVRERCLLVVLLWLHARVFNGEREREGNGRKERWQGVLSPGSIHHGIARCLAGRPRGSLGGRRPSPPDVRAHNGGRSFFPLFVFLPGEEFLTWELYISAPARMA
jgi:hypothetical protein